MRLHVPVGIFLTMPVLGSQSIATDLYEGIGSGRQEGYIHIYKIPATQQNER